LKQYAFAFAVSLLLALLLIITVSVIVYGEFLINDLTQHAYIKNDLFWISLLQVTVFILMVYIAVATLYFFGTREGRKTRFFSLGALVTTLLFIVTTYLFGIYIDDFSTYNELYGSLGALLIMMLYIWINSNLLLLGFELNIALYKLDLKQDRIKKE
jgi:membrane protein